MISLILTLAIKTAFWTTLLLFLLLACPCQGWIGPDIGARSDLLGFVLKVGEDDWVLCAIDIFWLLLLLHISYIHGNSLIIVISLHLCLGTLLRTHLLYRNILYIDVIIDDWLLLRLESFDRAELDRYICITVVIAIIEITYGSRVIILAYVI